MKLGIMQPYFFPYLGYFSLIKEVDRFIVFDTPQFIRHGWMDRNRVLGISGEPFYVRVALEKHAQKTPVNKIAVKQNNDSQLKLKAQLTHYKNKAQNYNDVITLLEECFYSSYSNLSDLNTIILRKVCKKIGIHTPIEIWSEMALKIEPPSLPDEWALNICKSIGARSYVNAINGKSFFDVEKYKKNEVTCRFLDFNPIVYKQFGGEFVPNLSIIDTLMFCDSNQINEMLHSFKLV